jgi:hypothetical protein
MKMLARVTFLAAGAALIFGLWWVSDWNIGVALFLVTTLLVWLDL